MVRGAVGAALVGVIVGIAPLTPAAAVGEVSADLIVQEFPGYVHESSSVDGPIDGGTLLEFGGESVDGSIVDYAETLKGHGRSWRAADGGAYALVWLLDCGDEDTAAQFLSGMDGRPADDGSERFDPGLTGATGWSGRDSGAYVHSVFWRQGSYVVDITIASGVRQRSRDDTIALARLEADTLQAAVGGTRTTEGPASSGTDDVDDSTSSVAYILGSVTGMALLGWGVVAAARAFDRRRSVRPLGPPLPSATAIRPPLPPPPPPPRTMPSSFPPPLVPTPTGTAEQLWVIPERGPASLRTQAGGP